MAKNDVHKPMSTRCEDNNLRRDKAVPFGVAIDSASAGAFADLQLKKLKDLVVAIAIGFPRL